MTQNTPAAGPITVSIREDGQAVLSVLDASQDNQNFVVRHEPISPSQVVQIAIVLGISDHVGERYRMVQSRLRDQAERRKVLLAQLEETSQQLAFVDDVVQSLNS